MTPRSLWYPLDRRLPVWTLRRRQKSLPSRESNPSFSAIQRIASCCTSWTILAPLHIKIICLMYRNTEVYKYFVIHCSGCSISCSTKSCPRLFLLTSTCSIRTCWNKPFLVQYIPYYLHMDCLVCSLSMHFFKCVFNLCRAPVNFAQPMLSAVCLPAYFACSLRIAEQILMKFYV
jgi:hypothetical protein